MTTRITLNDFYNDLTLLMQKYELTMDCRDEYNEDGWCGQQFTLRSKEPVDGKYIADCLAVKAKYKKGVS